MFCSSSGTQTTIAVTKTQYVTKKNMAPEDPLTIKSSYFFTCLLLFDIWSFEEPIMITVPATGACIACHVVQNWINFQVMCIILTYACPQGHVSTRSRVTLTSLLKIDVAQPFFHSSHSHKEEKNLNCIPISTNLTYIEI